MIYYKKDNKKGGILVNKRNRVIEIFYRFISGERMAVKELALQYEVSEKSIQRDISEIKNCIAEYGYSIGKEQIAFDRSSQKMYLEAEKFLTNGEMLAITKILIATRALPKDRMKMVVEKLEDFSSVKDKKRLKELVKNELFYYKSVAINCEDLIENLYSLSEVIDEKQEITITYYKMDKSKIERKVWPLAIVFSEFYFYLIARHQINGEFKDRYYRIDRITEMVKHRTHFQIKYDKRFNEGKLKNQIQYMWPGKNQEILFEFTGPSVQAVLDRIPESKIEKKEKDKYIIRAQVYGAGIKMFLLSQGSWVKVLEPQSFVQEMKIEAEKMLENYMGNN